MKWNPNIEEAPTSPEYVRILVALDPEQVSGETVRMAYWEHGLDQIGNDVVAAEAGPSGWFDCDSEGGGRIYKCEIVGWMPLPDHPYEEGGK